MSGIYPPINSIFSKELNCLIKLLLQTNPKNRPN